MKYKKTVSYELERYPEKCKECPCFSTQMYKDWYDYDLVAKCDLGYMDYDMRGFDGDKLFKDCNIRKDSRVTLFK